MSDSTARPLGIRITGPAVALLAMVIPALVAAGLAMTTLWWAFVVGGALLALILTVTVNGVLPARYLVWGRQRRRRRKDAFVEVPEPVVVETAAGPAAIVWGRAAAEVVALVELTPTTTLPTVITSDGRAYTEDCVPLAVLAGMTTQYGLRLKISVESVGERVAHGARWAALYAQLAGSLPVVARRSTWVVLRLDLTDPTNLAQVCARGPAESAAPTVLATAAHRVALRCREHGVRATVLAELGEFTAAWEQMNLTPLATAREHWSKVVTADGSARGYWARSGAVTTQTMTAIWAHPALTTAACINIEPGEDTDEAAQLDAGVVYLEGIKPISDSPDEDLQLAHGQQRPLIANLLPHYGLPAGTARPRTAAAQTDLDEISIPIGATGQILGRTKSGALMTVLLHDGRIGTSRKMRIEVTAEDFVVRQCVLRALSCGLAVAICTRDTQRWAPLIEQLGQGGELALLADPADPSAADLTIVDETIAERVPVRGSVMYLNPAERVNGADLTIAQPVPSQPAIHVTLPNLGEITLDLVLPRFEERYIGAFISSEGTGPQAGYPQHRASSERGRTPTPVSRPVIRSAQPAPPTSQLVSAAAGGTAAPAGAGRHASGEQAPPPVRRHTEPTATVPVSATTPEIPDSAHEQERANARELMAQKRAQARARANRE